MRRAPLALAGLALLGASPFREEHPLSREARERIAAGAAAGALESYDRLQGDVGARPEIELGRGAALLELERPAEARRAFARAREAPEPLGSRALLGLSDALAGAGDLEGAIAAAREALVRDPGYGDARENLETLLRRRGGERRPEPGAPSPGAEGKKDRGAGAGGDGREAGPGGPEAQQPAGGAVRREDAGREGGGASAGRPEREDAGGPGPEGALSRREAERLLDAMRARERNLPASVARPRGARRADEDRDW